MENIIKSFVMESGERYCLLVDGYSGLPLFYPNLFVTTQVLNRSLSYSTMESALSGISVLLRYMEERFQKAELFQEHELDAIRDFCQIKFRSQTKEDSNGIFNLFELREFDEKVSSQTEYVRLTVVAQYTKWLAEQFRVNSKDRLVVLQLGKMEKGIKTRRPVKKNRNAEGGKECLDKDQITLIFELFRPDFEHNPLTGKSVRVRNRLIFLILYHLGLRGAQHPWMQPNC